MRFQIPDMGTIERACTVYEAGEVFLGIEEAIEEAPVLMTEMSSGSHKPPSVAGVLNAALEIGSRQDLSYVVLHLPNFIACPTGIVLETNRVRITIKPVEDYRNLVKKLKGVGGYAITHVGKLEGTNSALVPVKEVKGTLYSLFNFLSFVCGSVVQPILPVGFDGQGNIAWQQWASKQIDSWRSENSPWCDPRSGDSISAVFRGFMACHRNELWEKPLRDAIHWYVVSNRRQGLYVEDAVVLTQAALEMLASVVLVEDPETAYFTRDQFDKLNAAQKLRCLLNWAGIPRDIPPETHELEKAAGAMQWEDGAEAFTTIRNGIVHTTSVKRKTMEKIPARARFEACSLGLWYLELVLLRLFNYEGDYVNRLIRGDWRCNAVRRVPWAGSKTAPTE